MTSHVEPNDGSHFSLLPFLLSVVSFVMVRKRGIRFVDTNSIGSHNARGETCWFQNRGGSDVACVYPSFLSPPLDFVCLTKTLTAIHLFTMLA